MNKFFFSVMATRAVRKKYKTKWMSASRSVKKLSSCNRLVGSNSDSSGTELESMKCHVAESFPNASSSFSSHPESDCDSMNIPNKNVGSSSKTVSFVSYLHDVSSSSESESDGEKCDDTDLEHGLIAWVNEFKIVHNAVDRLLRLLQHAGHRVPLTARSLLKTVKTVPTSVKSNMDYVYFDTEKQLQKFVHQLPSDSRNILKELEISLNIDGLPLFKSSSTSFWPVLCAVQNVYPPKVFPLALASGEGKPSDLDFLTDVVTDLKKLLIAGLQIDNRTVKIRLRCIVCDAPARSMVRAVKLYSGYEGCDKCVQRGEFRGRMTYPELTSDLRSDENFRGCIYPGHHNGTTPFCELPIDLVKTFPIDYMHQSCLGVTRKLLLTWMRGKKEVRLSAAQICEINGRLLSMKRFIPNTFSRLPRSLDEVDRWKATEFRLFMLYTGKIVLRGILPKALYEHFLTFSIALSILVSPSLSMQHRNYAHELLLHFVGKCKELYSAEFLVYNVHSLIHIASDTEEFGCLDSCSSFAFENYLQQLKKLVRSGRNPLVQIVKRMSEFQFASDRKSTGSFQISQKIKNNAYIVESSVCCEILPDAGTDNSSDTVLCRVYKKTRPLFADPCDSRIVQTFLTDARESTVEAVCTARLKSRAILVKIGSGFEMCFMAILHEI